MEQQQQQGRSRSVSFKERVKVRFHLHLCDMSKNEIESTWYKPCELRRSRTRNQGAIHTIEDPSGSTPPSCGGRHSSGMESVMVSAALHAGPTASLSRKGGPRNLVAKRQRRQERKKQYIEKILVMTKEQNLPSAFKVESGGIVPMLLESPPFRDERAPYQHQLGLDCSPKLPERHYIPPM